MKAKKFTALLFVLAVSNSALTHAQVVLTTASGTHSYSQDFNGLPSAGSATWTDNSSLSGWYATPAATGGFAGLIVATTGANGNFLGSFGASSAADRALGANPGGASKAWGVRLQNTGTTTITINTISFTGEEWRTGGTASAQTVTFAYQISAVPITNLTGGTYTALSGLNFTGSVTSPVDTNLNGNLSANQTAVSVGSLGLTIAAGSEVMLRWSYADSAGNDANLAIDDLAIAYTTAVPEPATYGMLLMGAVGGFHYLRKRRHA
ncbi:hypothetical protein BH09VER1_BH09VER1_55730 [soil metagenome]